MLEYAHVNQQHHWYLCKLSLNDLAQITKLILEHINVNFQDIKKTKIVQWVSLNSSSHFTFQDDFMLCDEVAPEKIDICIKVCWILHTVVQSIAGSQVWIHWVSTVKVKHTAVHCHNPFTIKQTADALQLTVHYGYKLSYISWLYVVWIDFAVPTTKAKSQHKK